MNSLLILASAFTLWCVDPYGNEPYLPWSAPSGGVVTNALGLAAAKGEIETVSFVVKPERDLKKVGFTPSDLVSSDGSRIPSSAADFALVKCWYRAGGRWDTSGAGNNACPALINDLILHDNDLVRCEVTDEMAKRTVLLRFSYPDGDVWVDMRKHGTKGRFRHEIYPVRDAPRFVPFDLKAGVHQQYWFTWKVPAEAKPGTYRGTLAVTTEGAPLQEIPVTLEVYPFALPTPRTHYDTSRRWIVCWMGTPNLDRHLRYSKDLAKSERKLRNVYRALAEHNAHESGGIGNVLSDSTDDWAVRSLILMRQAGMDCDLVINGAAYNDAWIGQYTPYVPPETNRGAYEKALADYGKSLDLQKGMYERLLGHHHVYFQGLDECPSDFHRKCFGFYHEIRRRGFGVWADEAVASDVGWAIDMNDIPASIRPTETWAWHGRGARAVTYAAPFTGPACPDMWRRTKGLRDYYADMDGIHDYHFCSDSANNWNDFVYRGIYSQFQIAYHTEDSVLSTLAWEASREAVDDVRYLSLLRLRAQAAMRSSDPAIRKLGRRHFVWMDAQDPEAIVDLQAFRREVARRIVELVAVVGEEPVVRTPKPPPELPPSTYGTAAVAGADRAKRIDEYVRENRYDLAIPLCKAIVGDVSADVTERIVAAERAVSLLGELARRDEAVSVAETALEIGNLSSVQRSGLRLLKMRALLTERVFEEEFSAAQLDAAAKEFASALATGGVSAELRRAALLRLADGYVAGGHFTDADAFVGRFIETSKPVSAERCDLLVRRARAQFGLGKLDAAAQAYRQAHATGVRFGRDVLADEARIAERRKDWKTAQRAYVDMLPMFEAFESDLKKACEADLARVSRMVKSSDRGATAEVEERPEIDLDE